LDINLILTPHNQWRYSRLRVQNNENRFVMVSPGTSLAAPSFGTASPHHSIFENPNAHHNVPRTITQTSCRLVENWQPQQRTLVACVNSFLAAKQASWRSVISNDA
jgi:hypothetical protein